MAEKFNVEIGYKVNKTGLNELKKDLQSLQHVRLDDLLKIDPNANKEQLTALRKNVSEVQMALKKSFNTDLGTLNIKKLNAEMKKLNLSEIYKSWNAAGLKGKQAFRDMTTEVLTTNLELRKTHKVLDAVAKSMANTVKWGINSSIFNNLTGSIQKAWSYTRDLDTSLNNIRIVTGKSADEMEKFAKVANKAAQGLGKSTKEYTDASLIYYQQGLGEEDVQARAEVTLKAANVTGQSSKEVSEQLTAVWNGYKVSASEAELYVDKLAKVAATTASDLEELSTGMSKVASAAAAMGVDVDQLNGMLSTIISVTRQAPESAGTALKTVFARMEDLKLGGKDDSGASLGDVSGALASLGIQIMNSEGQLRDLGGVIEEVGEKWNTGAWTQAQKQALAIELAGKRQYNNLLALFENWEMYTDAVETSQGAVGTLQEQQDIYMESTEAHLRELSAAWERVFDAFVNNDSTNTMIDSLTGLTNLLGNFIEMADGGGNVLLGLGSIGVQVFDKQIARGISTTLSNLRRVNENASRLKAQMELIQQVGSIEGLKDEQLETLVRMKQEILDYGDLVSEAQQNQANASIKNLNNLYHQEDAWQANIDKVTNYIKEIRGLTNLKISNITQEPEKQVTQTYNKEQYERQHKATIEELDSIIIQANTARKEADGLAKSIMNYIKAQNKGLDGIDEYFAAEEQIKSLVEEISTKDILGATSIDQANIDKILKDFGSIRTIDEENIVARGDQLLNNYLSLIGQIETRAKDARQTLEAEAEGAGASIKTEIEDVKQSHKQAMQEIDMEQVIQSAVDLAAAFGQVASAIQIVTHLGEIWKDESLSGGEKIIQTIMGISSVIGLLANSLPIINNGIKSLAVGLKVTGTAAELSFLSATKGVLAFNTALGPLWLVLVAIAGAIAVVGGGVYLFAKHLNAEADAAKAARKEAEALAESYNVLHESVNKFSDMVTKYNEAQVALDKLDKHTKEYTESLSKANAQAEELVETLNLYDKVSYKDGRVTIDPNALNEAYMEQAAGLGRAKQAMLTSQATADQKELIAQRVQLARQVQGTEVQIGDQQVSAAGLINQADIENIIRKLGELNEVEYQGVMKSNESFAQWIQTTYQGNTAMAELSEHIAKNKDSFDKLYHSTEALTDANKRAMSGVAEGKIREAYGKELLALSADEFGNINDSLFNQLVKIVSDTERQSEKKAEYADKQSRISAEWQSSKGFFSRVHSDKDFNKFFEQQGLDIAAIGGAITSKEDLTRKYAQYIKGYTAEQTRNFKYEDGILKIGEGKDISLQGWDKEEQAREGLLNFAILEEYEAKAEETTAYIENNLKQVFSKGHEVGAQFGVDFSQGLIDQMSNKDKKFDFSNIVGLDPKEKETLIGKNASELTEMFGGIDQIKSMGFETAEEFATAFHKGLEQVKWDPEEALSAALGAKKGEIERAGDGLSKKKLEQYSKDVEEYARHLMDVAESSEEVADDLEYNADAAVDFAFKIVKMNKAIDTLADNFKDWKAIMSDSSEASEEFAKAMNGTKEAIADVYDIQSEYISSDFVQEHLNAIEQISKGDAEAIDSLRQSLSEDVLGNILDLKLDNEIITESEQQALLDTFTNLREKINESLSGINMELGADVDIGSFQGDLQKIIDTAQMTEEQANTFLRAIGYEPTFKSQEMQVPKKTKITQTVHKVTAANTREFEDGTKVTEYTAQDEVIDLGEKVDNETVSVWGISGDGKPPQINTVKAAPTGGSNNYSSVNKGGKAPGKSGKKGGGGGKPKQEKHIRKEHDPYHDINIKIKDVQHELSMLTKVQNKFFGQKLIDNLNKQWALLGKNIELAKEKMQIASNEANRLKDRLAGKGVTFNADRTIANYAEAYKAQVNSMNALIDRYNKMSKAEQEAHNEELQKAKEDFAEFEKDIQNYDKAITDIIPGLEKDIQEAVDKQIEIQIKKFNMEIEIRLDMADAERDWNEFKKLVIDDIQADDILGNTKAKLDDFFSYYKENDKGIIQSNTDHVNSIITQLKQIENTGWSDVYGDNQKQALEDLQKYYQQLMTDLKSVDELSEEIHKSYLDMMDEAQDKFNEQVRTYEQVSDLIEHDMKLIELIKGDKAFGSLDKYYEKQEENYNQQLDFQRQQKDFWKAEMDSLEKGSDEWEKAKENWMGAVNEWNSLVEAAIENLQDKYLNAINNIFNELNNKLTQNKGLEYVSEEWDLINRNAEQYLDEINSLFETKSLENKYLNAIDQTDSVSAQRKLNELMNEELKALREKDKLTQYDIDRANLKYEIALKEIALQEAQQNKSQMRLRRDSQGNYSYQYVADADAVAQAEDELMGLKNSLYNLDAGQYKDKLDELLGVWTEFQEKMAEAAQINDPKERADRELLLKEQYGELINGLVEQNETIRTNLHESAFEDLANLYEVDISNFENMTKEEQDIILGELLPQWESGVQGMADAFAGEGGFIPTCQDAFQDLDEITKEYENDLNELENSAGVNFDSIANGLDNTINQTQDLITNNNDLINSYRNQLDAIGAVIKQLDDLILKYKIAKQEAIAATEAAYKYWQAQNNAAANAAGQASGGSGSAANPNNAGGAIGGPNAGGNPGAGAAAASQGGQGDGNANVGDVVTLSGSYYYDSFGTAPAGSRYSGVPNGVVIDRVNNNPFGIHIHSADGKFGDLGWVRKNQLTGYDTGGYTGSWNNSDGRLALLHQKELVLNAQDTANMLNAVKVLKGITDSIGSSMLSRLASLSDMVSPNINFADGQGDLLEQQVHIDASFPDVRDAREIEDALNNLVNMASQHVQKDNRRR